MKKFFRGATFYIVLFLVIVVIIGFLNNKPSDIVTLQTSEFIKHVKDDNIASVLIQEDEVRGTLRNSGQKFEAYIPNILGLPIGQELMAKVQGGKIADLDGKPPQETLAIFNILTPIIMILLFVVFWFVFMQNSQGGGNRVMSFGKSRAKLHKDDDAKKITFADVAGLDEEKEEMQEVVDFLRAPRKYIDLGARIPKGILMVGPPGTGKTYLTRAVAGEAGVPFFSISGSDFVEMFVGVGASRVRDLFENAKKNSPCIIFIDEIDAVGRKRGAGLGGGHDEREQTLNQLLVEMDGFSENESIIIIAATNRPDILDPALLRPGRFDREITVGLPDIEARKSILKVHAKNKPVSKLVNFKTVARGTPGFTPADLENLLNESAILAARNSERQISMKRIDEALTRMMMGVEKKSHIATERDRKITAYHEAGHAIMAKLLPNTEPVHQITIVKRGRAAGFVLRLPDNDDQHTTKSQMENSVMVALGGRIAEKIIFKDFSTGASSDLNHVSKVVRAMVTKYGMSENLSQMSYDTGGEVFIGRDMGHTKEFSDQVQAEIDREISKIVDALYEKAYMLISDNLDKLESVAQTLLEFETINGEEFDAVFEKGISAVEEIRAQNDGEMDTTIFKESEEDIADKASERAEPPVVEKAAPIGDDRAQSESDATATQAIDRANQSDEVARADDTSEE
ncbi:MAG: zinc metalloprotease [Clostridiales bacterium]|nr:MAG: zinc metalloprotease [Clostridiales bacterium]